MGELFFNFSGVILAAVGVAIAVFYCWATRDRKEAFIFAGGVIVFSGIFVKEVLAWLK